MPLAQDHAMPVAQDPAMPLAQDPAMPLAPDHAMPLAQDHATPLARESMNKQYFKNIEVVYAGGNALSFSICILCTFTYKTK